MVLVRAAATIPIECTLPPIVGGKMSPNLFLALVGGSGGGKGASEGAAEDAVTFLTPTGEPYPLPKLPIGSGEGIARTFMGDPEDRVWSAIFGAPEVSTLGALFQRAGSTLEGEVRKMYSGEQLGFTNSQKHTRTLVKAHDYRAGMILGVQPRLAQALMAGADGGTPQRFIWMPTTDPGAPDEPPVCPEPKVIVSPSATGCIRVPQEARGAIRRHRLAVLRDEPLEDPLAGHKMLTQLKVATALAVLDHREGQGHREGHRLAVSPEDWQLAGTVMAVSDRVAAQVLDEMHSAEMEAAAQRGKLTGISQHAARSTATGMVAEEERVAKVIVRKLARCGGSASRREAREAVASRDRHLLADALARGKALDWFRGTDGEVSLTLMGGVIAAE